MIFAFGIILILRHLHVWRDTTDQTDNPAEKRYLKSQLKRRCLTSSCVAVLGLIVASFAIARDPISVTFLTMAALLLMVFVLILATLEIFAVRHIIERHRALQQDAKAEMLKEHDRLKRKAEEKESEEGYPS